MVTVTPGMVPLTDHPGLFGAPFSVRPFFAQIKAVITAEFSLTSAICTKKIPRFSDSGHPDVNSRKKVGKNRALRLKNSKKCDSIRIPARTARR